MKKSILFSLLLGLMVSGSVCANAELDDNFDHYHSKTDLILGADQQFSGGCSFTTIVIAGVVVPVAIIAAYGALVKFAGMTDWISLSEVLTFLKSA